MLEEKTRKALAERDRIIQKGKKARPAKFKRSSRILANQLISARQASVSEDDYETVSESGDSPRKVRKADKTFGLVKPKTNSKLIDSQQKTIRDILNNAVALNKQMPEISLVIKPSVQVPFPPQSPNASGSKQLAKTFAFTQQLSDSPNPAKR